MSVQNLNNVGELYITHFIDSINTAVLTEPSLLTSLIFIAIINETLFIE